MLFHERPLAKIGKISGNILEQLQPSTYLSHPKLCQEIHLLAGV